MLTCTLQKVERTYRTYLIRRSLASDGEEPALRIVDLERMQMEWTVDGAKVWYFVVHSVTYFTFVSVHGRRFLPHTSVYIVS